ncbi:hypothetical protein D6774_03720 [Candidatus Woesearchaeota archaeon]|nr:MAG: hypothetical protein D6774_03720 [Candidatus Woesearchaeota archaeon]
MKRKIITGLATLLMGATPLYAQEMAEKECALSYTSQKALAHVELDYSVEEYIKNLFCLIDKAETAVANTFTQNRQQDAPQNLVSKLTPLIEELYSHLERAAPNKESEEISKVPAITKALRERECVSRRYCTTESFEDDRIRLFTYHPFRLYFEHSKGRMSLFKDGEESYWLMVWKGDPVQKKIAETMFVSSTAEDGRLITRIEGDENNDAMWDYSGAMRAWTQGGHSYFEADLDANNDGIPDSRTVTVDFPGGTTRELYFGNKLQERTTTHYSVENNTVENNLPQKGKDVRTK